MTSPYSAARWHAPLATTGLWALAAGAAVFWGLRLASPAQAIAPAATLPRAPVSADADAVARLFGALPVEQAAPAAPEAASRFALSGVVADPSNQGAALISIDGKPPRPFRVGSRVGEGYVLQSVGVRAATLGTSADGPAAFTLQLPVRAPLNVGSPLPAAPAVSPPQPSSPAQPPSPGAVGLLPATVPSVAAPPPEQQSGDHQPPAQAAQ
ncbi:general secretion pathway protein C [Variovorax sp. TBS-050B]|uniref:type II secretion system protein N n=1 Tax=Variovorax sp. TBS-050B TaxID=2940551 RepID=UPI0024744981|nr:type II secretion system protein N [Variovorax sp. TBS-050B]MDH6592962.1 general secretion pathway protein C [Variovorax sp. TBS-050B]